MKQETVTVGEGTSGRSIFGYIVLSVRNTYRASGTCEVVIGRPGQPNVQKKLQHGDAVLYETPDGIIEVRFTGFVASGVEFLLTQVSPRPGILAGAVDTNPDNAAFGPTELDQIAVSIRHVKNQLRIRDDITSEQLELITRKLDEIQEGAERMGRKDWINYVVGTLTTLCMSAAFAPEVTKAVFLSVDRAFSWLFSSGLLLWT